MNQAYPKTVLVTGAAGGVGRTLCRLLTQQGLGVRALIRPEDDAGGLMVSGENLVRGYIEDAQAVSRAMQGAGAVVNCAALLGNALHLGREAFQRVNVEGALTVLREAKKAKVSQAVFFSTISVVDHLTRKITPHQLQDYIKPRDAYLESKIQLERELKTEAKQFQGQIAVLRPTFVYGPDHLAVWSQALELVCRGKMMLLGEGDALLPLVASEDIARFTLLWLDRPPQEENFHIYILTHPEQTTMKQVFYFIADHLGVKRPRHVPVWPLSLAASLLAILPEQFKRGRLGLLTKTRLRQYSKGYDLSGVLTPPPMGFVPAIRYQEGLASMLNAYQNAARTPKS